MNCALSRLRSPKKERKKTDNPREGWKDGTPPPHRDFKESVAVGPWGQAVLFLFLFGALSLCKLS